jgi:hypothetical protein
MYSYYFSGKEERMEHFSAVVLAYVIAGSAAITELVWFYSKRKALRSLTLPRDIRQCEARFRKYRLRLTLLYIVLGFVIVFIGMKHQQSPVHGEKELQEELWMDSLEVDEFLEQYKEQKRSVEIE